MVRLRRLWIIILSRGDKMTVSKAQLKASAKYQASHKKDVYRNQTKSKAKKFIRDMATKEELIELQTMIQNKLK